MSHVETRLREIKAGRKNPTPRKRYTRRAPDLQRPMPATATQLVHIAQCLRRVGMVNFADVIERAADKLARYED